MIQQLRVTSPSLIIIIVTIFCFILQQMYGDVAELFMLHNNDLFNAPYTLITHMFLHSDFAHLLFNMLGVLIFGSLLERRVSRVQFAMIYLVSGFFAGLVGSFIYDLALGASAGVMAIVGAAAYFYPDVEFYLFGFYPVKLKHLAMFYFIYDVISSFGVNTVANTAHIIGLFFGIGFALVISNREKIVKGVGGSDEGIHFAGLNKGKKISRIEAHFSNGHKNPDRVVVMHSSKPKKTKDEEDFSKSMYVSVDESDTYLKKNK